MYEFIRSRFNTETIIIALLFIISIFNLQNIVKSKNKENKQILKGGINLINPVLVMLCVKMFLVSFILCLCLVTFTTTFASMTESFVGE